MLKMVLLAGAAIAASLTLSADHADAFGGRGYARRHARHAYHAPSPVIVQRVHVAPVVGYYRAPVYYPTPLGVGVGRYGSYYGGSYYGSSYHHFGYPAFGRGVSIGIGW